MGAVAQKIYMYVYITAIVGYIKITSKLNARAM
jgi:hypothetical protein